MPTYTYQCANCGAQFEQFQKFSDDPLTDCPSCEGRVRRVIHPVGVVFKGSGWYITDSQKNSSATIPSGDASAATTPESAPAATATEKKPVEAKAAD